MNTSIRTIGLLLCLLSLFSINNLIGQCDNDTIPPTIIPPADQITDCETSRGIYHAVNAALTDFETLNNLAGIASTSDNCPEVDIIELKPISFFNICSDGKVTRRFQAIDKAGNKSAIVEQIITFGFDNSYSLTIPQVNIDESCDASFTCSPFFPIEIDTCTAYQIIFNTEVTILPTANPMDQVIEWSGIHPCPREKYLDFLELPYLDVNGDGILGDAYDININNDSIFLLLPNQDPIFYSISAELLRYTQARNVKVVQLAIDVFQDLSEDCQRNQNEIGIENAQIQVTSLPSGKTSFVQADENGQFNGTVLVKEVDTLLKVNFLSATNYSAACPTTVTIENFSLQAPIEIDLPVLLQPCPSLSVDIGTLFLRRCFSNLYTVDYCNYSTSDIADGKIQLTLDPFLEIVSSELDFRLIEDNVYEFELPIVVSGACGQIKLTIKVSCEAAFGQTHCVEALAFPNEICDDADPQWSQASIEVDGECGQDSVQFRIKNVGQGNMIQDNSFVIIEDVLMLRNGQFKLEQGETMFINLPKTGGTYHLQAEQAEFHPGLSMPSTVVEGCGGLNPGLVNILPQDDNNSFKAIDCQENIGAFDPNDKGATPTGVNTAHYLAENTDIEYKIRFQNTGTDTAFKVVILDTLTTHLDASTVIPGTSSHPYEFEKLADLETGLNILRFTFNDIMLPDSNVNESASQGFIQFKVSQQPDLADEILIENTAAIYFDFNEPVITNTVFHTIGLPFSLIISNYEEAVVSDRKILVQPNPFTQKTTLNIAGHPIKNGILSLYNLTGQQIRFYKFEGSSVDIYKEDLSTGIYFFKVVGQGNLIASGRILLQE